MRTIVKANRNLTKMEVLILLLTIGFGITVGASRDNQNKVSDKESAKAFLLKYNYLSDARTNTDQNVQQAIRSFQEFFKLEVTGELNEQTITLMNKPRCGNPDEPSEPRRYKRYKTAGRWYKWRKNDLKYFLQPGNDLDEATERRLLKAAFDMWARYTNFKFTAVDSPDRADIKISWGKNKHGGTSVEDTCRSSFDGWGGTLAHAYHPEDGRLHFDDSETFGDGNSLLQYDYLEVAAHEIGHILGMSHSQTKESLMYPYYQGNSPVKLFQDDIDGIQAHMGNPNVQYFMGKNGESCDAVCDREHMRCAETRHNFPLEGAMEIFKSLGRTCKTSDETDNYRFPDNPGQLDSTDPDFPGHCMGYKNIPDVINCKGSGYDKMQRLCPCRHPWE